jgi:hypothetical protein
MMTAMSHCSKQNKKEFILESAESSQVSARRDNKFAKMKEQRKKKLFDFLVCAGTREKVINQLCVIV